MTINLAYTIFIDSHLMKTNHGFTTNKKSIQKYLVDIIKPW